MRICPNCQLETEARVCPTDGYQTIDKTLVSEASDPLLGKVFEGRYRVDRKLGEGGMGAVYEATQLSVGRRVAIKIMHTSLARNLKHAARFQQEARAIAALDHPNAVRLVDFGCSEAGQLYLVMQYLTGRPLDQVLDTEAPLASQRVEGICRPVLEVLSQAHSQGIIHRDLKPENIFLAKVGGHDDFIKVLDFGIAKVSGQASARMTLTATGSVVGSPCYMSPEQATGNPITPLSDLYSLGVIMYELLTGQALFDKQTANGYMMAHAVEPPRWPEAHGQRLEGPFIDFVMRCLEKDPRRRPQSAAEALAILNAMPAPSVSHPPVGRGAASASARRFGSDRPPSGVGTNIASTTLRPRATWWRAPVAAVLGFGAITALVVAFATGPSTGEGPASLAPPLPDATASPATEANAGPAATSPPAAAEGADAALAGAPPSLDMSAGADEGVSPAESPDASAVAESPDASANSETPDASAIARPPPSRVDATASPTVSGEPTVGELPKVRPKPAPRYHRVTVQADPSTARILVNGRVLGRGKAVVSWRLGTRPPTVTIDAEYYKSRRMKMRTRDDGKVRQVQLEAEF